MSDRSQECTGCSKREGRDCGGGSGLSHIHSPQVCQALHVKGRAASAVAAGMMGEGSTLRVKFLHSVSHWTSSQTEVPGPHSEISPHLSFVTPGVGTVCTSFWLP